MNAIPFEANEGAPGRARDDGPGRGAVVDYYTEAGADYEAWSTRWNMHFGFPVSPADVFRREQMLENMNDAVLDRVQSVPPLVGPDSTARVADLGCGLGATMRRGANRHRDVVFVGFTIVDWQIGRGRALNGQDEGGDRVEIHRADYVDLPVADASFQGAYALEAACYAPGTSKVDLVSEAARILEPGAKFVVADGFRIDGGRSLSGPGRWIYRTLCDSWAIDELADRDQFVAALDESGFEDVRVEDVSWRVAWSVMWVPLVTLKFLWACAWRGELVAGWRAANVIGSVLTMLLGLMRRRFRYLIITARRGNTADAGCVYRSLSDRYRTEPGEGVVART